MSETRPKYTYETIDGLEAIKIAAERASQHAPNLDEGKTATGQSVLRDAAIRRLFFGPDPQEVAKQASRKLRRVIVRTRRAL